MCLREFPQLQREDRLGCLTIVPLFKTETLTVAASPAAGQLTKTDIAVKLQLPETSATVKGRVPDAVLRAERLEAQREREETAKLRLEKRRSIKLEKARLLAIEMGDEQ